MPRGDQLGAVRRRHAVAVIGLINGAQDLSGQRLVKVPPFDDLAAKDTQRAVVADIGDVVFDRVKQPPHIFILAAAGGGKNHAVLCQLSQQL